jgi:hypothetical protein
MSYINIKIKGNYVFGKAKAIVYLTHIRLGGVREARYEYDWMAQSNKPVGVNEEI